MEKKRCLKKTNNNERSLMPEVENMICWRFDMCLMMWGIYKMICNVGKTPGLTLISLCACDPEIMSRLITAHVFA